jgi:GT2 family glycosyltransferase
MKIGLVLVNYNDAKRTINSYLKYKNFFNINEVVVVDNDSIINDKHDLNKFVDYNDLVFNLGNFGYSKGNNIGIDFLNSKGNFQWIVISNSDVEISENDFNVIYNSLETSDYSLLTGVMHESDHSISKMVYWRKTTFFDDLLSNFLLLRKFVKKYNYHGVNYPSNSIKEVYAVPGSFFLINNLEFKRIKYFDENVFLFHEEDILAHKLAQNKKKVGVVLNSKFIHNHKQTIMSPKLYKYYLISKNYYQRTYNKVNIFLYFLLIITFIYSFFEHYFYFLLFNKRYRRKL